MHLLMEEGAVEQRGGSKDSTEILKHQGSLKAVDSKQRKP